MEYIQIMFTYHDLMNKYLINFENFLSFEQISDDYIKTEYILHV